jgi:serine protease 7 (enterokinase)
MKNCTHLFTCGCFMSEPSCMLFIHQEDGWEKRGIIPAFKDLTSSFSFGTAVYTGSGPVEDVFSVTNRMSVLFITDTSVAGGGFKANFTTGYQLGVPGKTNYT